MAKQHSPLPTPATAQEMYANAIVMELRELNEMLDKLVNRYPMPFAANEDEIELREPEAGKAKATQSVGKKASAKAGT